MSTEKIIYNEKKDLTLLISPEINNKISSGRVDINDLIARVRLEKKKAHKESLVFFSLFASLIVIIGIMLSL